MADKSIGQLVAATQVTPQDLFVLEQSGTAKKLTGQILENWLVSLADGHGGIQSITKTGTSGLVDTYTITLADTTTVTFTVTNGRAISSISTFYAVSSNGTTPPTTWSPERQSMTAVNRYLWSYQHIVFNGGNPSTIDTVKTVIGVWGDKGDKGDAGRGIESLAQTQRVPQQYTVYTFTMSDDTTESFTVYDGIGINRIEKTATIGLVDTYTITYSDSSTTTFTVTNAKSITSVTLTSTVGLIDTYTVAFNDGTSTTFNVTNGASIASIEKTSTVGLVDTYTVTLTNGDTETFTVTNAKSIVSVIMTSGTHAPGTTDTYTITFNDGDTTSFTVYNGTNGTGSVAAVDGIQAINQNVPLLMSGNGPPTTTTIGQLWQRYFDLTNHILYICTAIDDSGPVSTYTWSGTGVPVDSALSSTSQNPVQNAVITAKVGTESLNTSAQNLSGAVNELKVECNGLALTKTEQSVIATRYSSGSQTYTEGQYLIYSNKLYRCINSYTGVWVASNWQQIKVTDEINLKGLPTGGTDGDVLVKNGATNYASKWERPKYLMPNLLDNWYFAKGFKSTGAYGVFPVNQRRRAAYTTPGFTVDRWSLSGANTSLSLDTDAISIGSTSDYASITQMVSDGASLVGKTITFSAFVDTTNYVTVALLHGTSYANSSIIASRYSNASGVISLQHTITSDEINTTYPNLYVRIIMDSGKTGKIIAAKLEVGNMQTLARWDGANWVLNEIPVYADELRKCQAYFQRFYSQLNYGYGYGFFAAGYAVSATQIRAPISLATALPLMDTPSIITSGSFQLVPVNNMNAPIAVTSISVFCNATTSLFLIAGVSGGLTAGTAYFLRHNNDASAYIDILAET